MGGCVERSIRRGDGAEGGRNGGEKIVKGM